MFQLTDSLVARRGLDERYYASHELRPEVLEYHRRRSVIFQSECFGFVIEDDLADERRRAFSHSFGVQPDFDERELVVGRSSGYGWSPARSTCTDAPIRDENDAHAAGRQGRAIGILNRIPDYLVCPKV